MRVGIDFDNTIANYDRIFVAAARARGWVAADFHGSKQKLRDQVRLLADGETKWQMLQGEIYGPRMSQATPCLGVIEFFRAAHARGIDLVVVSHKTRHSPHDPQRVDLRQAALNWLEVQGFFDLADLGLKRDRVFFEGTRSDKISRIKSTACTVFIDDLREVLIDPAFPQGIKRILFSPDSEPTKSVITCATWTEIQRHILGTAVAISDPSPQEKLSACAGRLAGAAIGRLGPTRPGGNNRVYRVETIDGKVFALKSYPCQPMDQRDRLGTEFKTLQFLKRHDIGQVPRPIAADARAGYALYEWIEGQPTTATVTAVDAALVLLRSLNEASASPDAAELPFASEACLSASEIVAQLEQRLAALVETAGEHSELTAFLDRDFRPVMQRAVARARRAHEKKGLAFDLPLDLRAQRLCPSDFGFHNALTTRDGRIVFIDFEYFGWDDPAKTCCDFVLHPGMDLTAALRQRFLDGVMDIFQADSDFGHRLRTCLPLYALRWTMILLNEFLPDRWQRRVLAGVGNDRATVLRLQLEKAKRMLAHGEPAEEGLSK